MSIERQKAQDLKLDFSSKFVNINLNECEQDTTSSFCPLIHCDESRIMQVLFNLQQNALKFTKKGKVKIIIQIVTQEDDERYLQISVVDTGIGIDKKDHSKLKKLFGFVEEQEKINSKGIGLGLMISE